MLFDRRRLLSTGAVGLAFSGFARHAQAQAEGQETYVNDIEGYGPLKRDPNGLLDLPEGFTYRIISQGGETMDDGLYVPQNFDGMGCFSLEGSRIALVRNHELKASRGTHRNWGPAGYRQEREDLIDLSRVYDVTGDGRVIPGGTTTLIYDMSTGRTERQFLSLAGTSTNCCGGHTPWGSWLTCEETEEAPDHADVRKPHGFVFEVPAQATDLVKAEPLKAMGRFDHEAVCIDPRTGIVYLTEDKTDGLFYRFIPETPGELIRGGRLQALGFRDQPGADSTNHQERVWEPGDWREAVWIDLEEVESPKGDLRHRGYADGAVRIARGEGVFWAGTELFMTATSGGPLQRGQILRYTPSPEEGRPAEARNPGRIQLFVESASEKTLNMADNLTVAPWGHLVVCEDNYSSDIRNHVKGVTPQGEVYAIARNVFTGNSEFAGAVFSPDGSTLFVNLYYPGLTYAITGPWNAVRR
jgi:secreted PhoX family phosphatase